MGTPAPSHDHKRACPGCNRPVREGYTFCEYCGTPLMEEPVCSQCGALFMGPVRFCESCGAPAVSRDVGAEPEEPAEPGEDEDGLSGSEEPGTGEEDLPDPDVEEEPADTTEEPADGEPEEYPAEEEIPSREEVPRRYSRVIREPDTAEIMDKYWDEDEPPSRKPTGRSSRPREPGPGSSRQSPCNEPSPAAGNALFVFDDDRGPAGRKEPVRDRRMSVPARAVIIGIALLLLLAAGYLVVLPLLQGVLTSETPAQQSSVTVITEPVTTVAAITPPTHTPAPGSMVTQPTQTSPPGQTMYFQVTKSPITSRILVIYAGSAGHGSISSAEITVTHPDGSVGYGIILPLKGITEIILDGSKGADRVEIIAKMTSGESYRVYDSLVT